LVVGVVVPRLPSVPARSIALIALGAPVLANVVAAIPGRIAAPHADRDVAAGTVRSGPGLDSAKSGRS
jgi:hypothetical protein